MKTPNPVRHSLASMPGAVFALAVALALCPIASAAEDDADGASLPKQPDPAPATPAPQSAPRQPEKIVPELLWRKARVSFNGLFNLLQSVNATMSPDGRYLAIVGNSDRQTAVLILDLADKNKRINTVPLGAEATEINAPSKIAKTLKERGLTTEDLRATSAPQAPLRLLRRQPVSIRWMRWVTPTRLILETNWDVSYNRKGDARWTQDLGTILAIDADNPKAKTLVTSDDVAESYTTTTYSSYSMGFNSSGGWGSYGSYGDGWSSGGWNYHNNFPSFPETHWHTIPRRPSIFGISHDIPDTLIISTQNRDYIQQYKLNYITGKLRGHDSYGYADAYMLADRAGKYRIGFPTKSSGKPPYTYGLKRGNIFIPWRRLDEISKTQAIKGFSVTAENYLGHRAIPVGFGDNPDILYYASNMGRDTHGLYAMNTKTAEPVDFKFEHPLYDVIPESTLRFSNENTLVFDRYTGKLAGIRYNSYTRSTHWLNKDIQAVQDNFENMFPGYTTAILEWSKDNTRFLINIQGLADPGGMYLYDSKTKALQTIIRAAPWFDRESSHYLYPFSVANKAGTRITGVLIIPRAARLKNMPLVVYCPPNPWQRTPVGFSRELVAFAEMGFAVLQVNGRGTEGFGLAQLEMPANEPFEKTKIEDIISAIDYLSAQYTFDASRVALVGASYGGYQALRGLQLQPGRFRCAVAIQSPIDLGRFLDTELYARVSPAFFDERFNIILRNRRAEVENTVAEITNRLSRAYWGNRELLKQNPLLRNPGQITKPVLLLAGPEQFREDSPVATQYTEARRMYSALKKHNPNANFIELPEKTRGEVNMTTCLHMQDFLNVHLYDFQTELGPLIEVKEPRIAPPKIR